MNQIDERLREFRAYVPDASPGQASDLGRQFVAGAAWSNDRRRPNRIGRLVGVVGVASLATMFGVLFVNSNKSTPNKPATGEPTASWGIDAAITVTTASGEAPSTSDTDATVTALEARAEAFGIKGFSATIDGPGRVTARVPAGSQHSQQLTELLVTASPRIYDLSTDVLAASDDGRAILRAIVANTPKGAPTSAYTVLSTPALPEFEGQTLLPQLSGGWHTREEAKRFLPKGGSIVPIPEGLAILSIDNLLGPDGINRGITNRTLVVRDRPLARSADIKAAHADGDRVVLTLSEEARARVAAVLGGSNASLALTIGTGSSTGINALMTGSDTRIAGNEARFRTWDAKSATLTAALLARGGFDGSFTLDSTKGYGTEPPLLGARLSTPPEAVTEHPPAGLDPSQIYRVLRAPIASGGWTLYATRLADGSDLAWPVRTGTTNQAGGGGLCEPAVGEPALSNCGTFTGPPDPIVVVGRVGPTVDRVEAHFRSGSVIPVTSDNGWFLFVGERNVGNPDILVALDATGAEVGRIDQPLDQRVFSPGG